MITDFPNSPLFKISPLWKIFLFLANKLNPEIECKEASGKRLVPTETYYLHMRIYISLLPIYIFGNVEK